MRGRCADRSATQWARVGGLVSSSQPPRASLDRAPACPQSPRRGEAAARIAASRCACAGELAISSQPRARASWFFKPSLLRGRCADRSAALCARGRARQLEQASSARQHVLEVIAGARPLLGSQRYAGRPVCASPRARPTDRKECGYLNPLRAFASDWLLHGAQTQVAARLARVGSGRGSIPRLASGGGSGSLGRAGSHNTRASP